VTANWDLVMTRSSDAAFPLSIIRDQSFQLRQIRRVLLLTIFFIVQSTLVLGVFYHQLLGKLVEGTSPLLFASEELAHLNERIPSITSVMSQWLIVMLVINAIISGALAVYIMRRLGNPMLAIRRALVDIGNGNLDVRLRSGDASEFGELSEALNGALESVQGKIEEARRSTSIAESLDQQPPPDAEDVRRALIDCHAALTYFDGDKVGIENQSAANS